MRPEDTGYASVRTISWEPTMEFRWWRPAITSIANVDVLQQKWLGDGFRIEWRDVPLVVGDEP